ncbi:hypothetical protein [Muriicola sp.]|uniref:hypothetical protein n=1 Tax=Muriicola sp. TaxID=2020856 RepID=UPI003C74F65D
MLYIISGASRAGKTILAKKIATQKGIPYLSLDWIMMGFSNGIPEYGVHDLLFPDDIAHRLWGFLKAMMESMIYVETDCVIEGEALLPELLIELVTKYPNELRVCFLGYTRVPMDKKCSEIRAYSSEKSDWLADKPDAYVIDHVQNMMAHSSKIKSSCTTHNLRYLDTSENFLETLREAENYLLRDR